MRSHVGGPQVMIVISSFMIIIEIVLFNRFSVILKSYNLSLINIS